MDLADIVEQQHITDNTALYTNKLSVEDEVNYGAHPDVATGALGFRVSSGEGVCTIPGR
jgi:hypothetical protein